MDVDSFVHLSQTEAVLSILDNRGPALAINTSLVADEHSESSHHLETSCITTVWFRYRLANSHQESHWIHSHHKLIVNNLLGKLNNRLVVIPTSRGPLDQRWGRKW